jgi:hypothetical protein
MALGRTDVSEELSASFIRVTTIGELGTTLAVTTNRRMLRRNTKTISNIYYSLEITPNLQNFLEEPHGVTSQKTQFFITLI